MKRALAILGFLALAPLNVQAKTFANAYVSFELPDKWACVLEQTEWVCRPSAIEAAPQAIIILTAKEVGPSDSLAAYEQHLKTPRVVPSRTGQPLQSQILKVETRQISGHPWVDGMHKASEVPNYFTRYLATTKDKIAVLVTFSAHQAHYTRYSGDFFKAIESLRVIATSSLMKRPGDTGGGPFGTAGGGMGEGFEGEAPPEAGAGEGGGGFSTKTKAVLSMALLLALVGIYLVIKRGKKR